MKQKIVEKQIKISLPYCVHLLILLNPVSSPAPTAPFQARTPLEYISELLSYPPLKTSSNLVQRVVPKVNPFHACVMLTKHNPICASRLPGP
jgi:hypothetical protein